MRIYNLIFVRKWKTYLIYILQLFICILLFSTMLIIKYNSFDVVKKTMSQKVENRKIIAKEKISKIKKIREIESVIPIINEIAIMIKNDNENINNLELKIKHKEEIKLEKGVFPKSEDEVLITKSLEHQLKKKNIIINVNNIEMKMTISGVIDDGGRYVILSPKKINKLIENQIINYNDTEILIDNYENIEKIINKLSKEKIKVIKSDTIQEREFENINNAYNIFNVFFIFIIIIIGLFVFFIIYNCILREYNIMKLFKYIGYNNREIYRIFLNLYGIIIISSVILADLIARVLCVICKLQCLNNNIIGSILLLNIVTMICIKIHIKNLEYGV